MGSGNASAASVGGKSPSSGSSVISLRECMIAEAQNDVWGSLVCGPACIARRHNECVTKIEAKLNDIHDEITALRDNFDAHRQSTTRTDG